MTVRGVDYSSGRPSHAALKAAGVSFVCRYVGSTVHGTGRSAKWLTPAEAASLHADGLDVVVVFETVAQRAEAGEKGGVGDAHTAVADLAYCGLPADLPVYFAVDYDATVGPNITGYFRGVASVLGLKRVGAYGGYKVVKALFDKGLITYGWQTYAWSGGEWDARAQIQQYANGQKIDGSSVDYDRAMHAEFGQWRAKPAAPAPKPWPGRYLRVKSPLMHGLDVEWVQERLNRHGASPRLKVDGEYGSKTAQEVHDFQVKQHFSAAQVDGVVGPKTWAALAK